MSNSQEPSTSDASRRERMLQIMDEQRHSRPIPGLLSDSLRWDPIRSQSDNSESQQPTPTSIRAGKTSWCSCGSCAPMSTEVESKCCREVPNARRLLKRKQKCVCSVTYLAKKLTRRRHIVELYRYGMEYNWQHLTELEDFQESDYRRVAYRAFTLWVHGRLGIRKRRVIPSCVVNLIRKHFPAPDKTYMGFIPASSDPSASDMLE